MTLKFHGLSEESIHHPQLNNLMKFFFNFVESWEVGTIQLAGELVPQLWEYFVGRGSPPEVPSVPVHPCWVYQSCKALAAFYLSDFPEQQGSLRWDDLSPQTKTRLASSCDKSIESPKLSVIQTQCAWCLYKSTQLPALSPWDSEDRGNRRKPVSLSCFLLHRES